jgi:eukaryotic-like serine/threonine-protein kinase
MGEPRRLIEILTLPFKSAQTIYEGSSEVRLYVNEITKVKQIGKRVHDVAFQEALGVKEATLLQSIQHDHLVPVHDVVDVSGEPDADPIFKPIEMIMPYYERGSVFDILVKKKERFKIGDAIRLTRHFLLGLDFLQEEKRLIHRDMKSGNVFIDDQGRGRVGDLGVAVPMEADGTAEAFHGGLQLYTAPETFPTKRSDRRTDIYGVGLILHEMLNGPFPYEIYDQIAIAPRLDKGRRAIRDRDLAFKPYVPRRLRTIVNKAISLDPADRYGSVREMLAELGKARFIDWQPVGESTWEGSVPGVPEVSYQVSANWTKTRKNPRGFWRLSGKRKLTDWRKFIDDQDVVGDMSDRPVHEFFDQMVAKAIST